MEREFVDVICQKLNDLLFIQCNFRSTLEASQKTGVSRGVIDRAAGGPNGIKKETGRITEDSLQTLLKYAGIILNLHEKKLNKNDFIIEHTADKQVSFINLGPEYSRLLFEKSWVEIEENLSQAINYSEQFVLSIKKSIAEPKSQIYFGYRQLISISSDDIQAISYRTDLLKIAALHNVLLTELWDAAVSFDKITEIGRTDYNTERLISEILWQEGPSEIALSARSLFERKVEYLKRKCETYGLDKENTNVSDILKHPLYLVEAKGKSDDLEKRTKKFSDNLVKLRSIHGAYKKALK